MTMLNVRRKRFSFKRQTGTTLVELLIASLIGLIAIGTIGSIFISGQRIAKDKSLELLLLQSLNSTIQVMKEDIQRAGFDNNDGAPLTLKGETEVLSVVLNGVGFAYYRPDVVASERYRSVLYKKDGIKLQVCENMAADKASLEMHASIGNCFSLLDESIIEVTNFTVTEEVIDNGKAKSSFITIVLTGKLVSNSLTETATISFKQRNWL